MRILVLTDLFPPVAFGGYEAECAALVERLRARHDVLVLTSDLDRATVPPEPGVERTLPYAGGDRLRAVVRAPVAAVRGARTVRAALARFRPDLVYVSNSVGLPQAAVLIAVRCGAPVVCRFSERFFATSFVTGDRFLRSLRPGERGPRAALAVLNRVVNAHPALRVDVRTPFPASLSWASAALREEAGVPALVRPERERVIHPATPRAALFAAVERAPVVPPVIAYVGRVTAEKGADLAVRALAELRARHGGDARLVFAGACQPDAAARLDALAAQLSVTAHVERLGLLSAEALAQLMGQAAVVLVPTVEFEAYGLVLVEAALARAPVVAARIGGIPEALTDDDAVLFSPGDAGACAAALHEALSDAGATAARVDRAAARARALDLADYLDRSEELIADAIA